MENSEDRMECLQDFTYELNEDGISWCLTGLGEKWEWSAESIVIPQIYNGKTVTSIAAYSIPSYEWIKAINIPSTLMYIHPDAFFGGVYFEEIVVAKGNLVYHSSGNCLIKTKAKELILGCCTSVIPNDGSVTIIAENAFQYCEGFQKICIPESITDIRDYSFYECSNLETIELSENIMHIGEAAFAKCTNLKTVIFRGTKDNWHKISIGGSNDYLMSADKIFEESHKNKCLGFV